MGPISILGVVSMTSIVTGQEYIGAPGHGEPTPFDVKQMHRVRILSALKVIACIGPLVLEQSYHTCYQ